MHGAGAMLMKDSGYFRVFAMGKLFSEKRGEI
jgi:hypothetical protein